MRGFEITRLSRKVQDYITLLENKIEHLTEALTLEDSNVSHRVGIDRFPLPRDAYIHYQLGEDYSNYIDFRREGETLIVSGGHPLIFKLEASNVVHMRVR